jgi:hypothetical protein
MIRGSVPTAHDLLPTPTEAVKPKTTIARFKPITRHRSHGRWLCQPDKYIGFNDAFPSH